MKKYVHNYFLDNMRSLKKTFFLWRYLYYTAYKISLIENWNKHKNHSEMNEGRWEYEEVMNLLKKAICKNSKIDIILFDFGGVLSEEG